MIRTIRQLREDAGLSQLKLSMKSAIPQSSISNVENGHRAFSPNEAAKLAPHLGTTADDLVEVGQAQVVLKRVADSLEEIRSIKGGECPEDLITTVGALEQLYAKSPRTLVKKAARHSLSMIHNALKEGNAATKEAATKDVDASDPKTGFGGRDPLGRRIDKPVPDRDALGRRRDTATHDRDGLGRRREKDVPDRDAFGKRPGHEPPPRDASGRAREREEK